MKNIIITICLLLFFSACKDQVYTPQDLRKLSHSEIIERAKQKDFPDFETVVFKNQKGDVIPIDSLQNLYNPEDWASDWFIDDQGAIKELVFRPATEEDKQFTQKLKEAIDYQPPIELVDIDCDQQQEILQKVFDSDQGMRTNGGEIDPEIDRQNLTTVISLIEKCGMPTLELVNDVQMSAIWAVFQHGDNANRKKYIPLLEEAAKNGDLKTSQIAMMKDRTLVMDGKPQVYGTQVTKRGNGWELNELENPESVNKRRAEMGLEPLQNYLDRWEIKFDIKQVE